MKKKVFKQWFSVFLIFCFIVPLLPQVTTAEKKEGFIDLSKYQLEVKELVELGIIKGYADQTFRPNESITREQGIAMIVREMKLDTASRPNPNFKDVKPNQRFYGEIAAAVEEGIISGKSNGTFGFNEKMTRAQMAKILADAYHLQVKEGEVKQFKDVPARHWAYTYITKLVSNEITAGYTDGTFQPEAHLTRLHFSLFLSRYINGIKKEKLEDDQQSDIYEKFSLKSDKTSVLQGQVIKINLVTEGTEELTFKTSWKAAGGTLTAAADGKSAEWKSEENVSNTYIVTATIEVTLKSGKTFTFDKTISVASEFYAGESYGGGGNAPIEPPRKVLTSGDNKTTLLASTIFIDEGIASNVKVNEDATQVIFPQSMTLKAGEVFLLPAIDNHPGGLALKAKNVTTQDGKTIVETIEPKLQEVFYSIKGDTNTTLSPEYFVPAEGVTVESPVVAASFSSEPNSNLIRAAAINDTVKINLGNLFRDDDPIKFNGTLELDGDFNGEIDWAWEADLVDSFEFGFVGSQALKGEVVAQIDNDDPDKEIKKKIGNFHIPTEIPGVTVHIPLYIVVNWEGKVGVEFSASTYEDIGIKYDDRKGARVVPEDNFRANFNVSDPKVAGKAAFGINAPVYAAAAGIDLVGISQEVGVSAEAKISIIGTNGLFRCAKIEPALYYKAKVSAPFLEWESESDVTKEITFDDFPFGNCIRNITIHPSELNISPGAIKELTVTADDGFNNSEDITGDRVVTFTSSDPDIIKVTDEGEITAASNAQDGDEVTISAKLKVNGKSFEDITNIKIVDQRESGTLVGKVVDAVSEEALKGASIKIYNGDRLVKEVASEENGAYKVSLVPGTYRVVVKYDDYITETSTVVISSANVIMYDAKLQLVGEQYAGIGTVSGTITNAVTGVPVPQVTLEIRRGRNNTDGDSIETVQTNQNGQYKLELPGGNYTVQIKGAGYVSTFYTVVSVGDQTRTNQNATISPEGLLGESIRVVLNWGATPYDLDSHLTGPTDQGSRFHVYYSNRKYQDSQSQIALDVDDTSSYGPETVTIIKRLTEGTYVYAIHNYSARNSSSGNYSLSKSEATVRVYSGNILLATFNVPMDKAGNVWKVFEIRNGLIVPINKVGYPSEWSESYLAPEPIEPMVPQELDLEAA